MPRYLWSCGRSGQDVDCIEEEARLARLRSELRALGTRHSALNMDRVLILDFGSQYTQLIARRVRELRVYSEIHPYSMPAAEIRALQPTALILSGSPASIYQPNAPKPDPEILTLGLPTLGICYGLCVLTDLAGGQVARAARREYGPADLLVDRKEDLFADLPPQVPVWMSHGDQVTDLPGVFRVLAH